MLMFLAGARAYHGSPEIFYEVADMFKEAEVHRCETVT